MGLAENNTSLIYGQHVMIGDILIIDDTFEDIATLNHILQGAGHSVRAARDGTSGLRAARSSVPDLVLLDVLLPDQDGVQVCEQFRKDELLSSVPIIFVSALHDVSLKARAFEKGGHDYITKPYNHQEVVVRVQYQLERVHFRDQLQEAVRNKERQHIARELHDSVSQTLFVLNATLQSMLMDFDSEAIVLQDQVKQLHTLSRAAQAEMRALLNELRPSQIRQAPIKKLFQQLIDAFSLRIEAQIHAVIADGDLPESVKLAFYRIAQEALNNAAKYASASRLTLQFLDEAPCYRLIIEDDGRGFNPEGKHAGMGLHTMRERAEQLNIDFSITSALGAGTRIEAVWYS